MQCTDIGGPMPSPKPGLALQLPVLRSSVLASFSGWLSPVGGSMAKRKSQSWVLMIGLAWITCWLLTKSLWLGEWNVLMNCTGIICLPAPLYQPPPPATHTHCGRIMDAGFAKSTNVHYTDTLKKKKSMHFWPIGNLEIIMHQIIPQIFVECKQHARRNALGR